MPATVLALLSRLGDECRWQQLHPALGAVVGGVADDLRVHRAGVARRSRGRDQLHSALGATVGLFADDVGVHRTRVDDGAVGNAHVHLGDQSERLVRRRVDISRQSRSFRHPLGVVTERRYARVAEGDRPNRAAARPQRAGAGCGDRPIGDADGRPAGVPAAGGIDPLPTRGRASQRRPDRADVLRHPGSVAGLQGWA